MLLIGPSGCGKTTFAKQLIKNCPRIIALDSNFEYASEFNLRKVSNPLKVTPNSALQTTDYSLDTINRFIIATRQFTDCLVVYEDLDMFIQNAPPEEIRNFQINSRHQGLGQLAVCKRLIGMPMLLLQKADYIRIWQMSPLLQENDVKKYLPAIPTLEKHMKLSAHSAILYKMNLDVAKPIHVYNCKCEICRK